MKTNETIDARNGRFTLKHVSEIEYDPLNTEVRLRLMELEYMDGRLISVTDLGWMSIQK